MTPRRLAALLTCAAAVALGAACSRHGGHGGPPPPAIPQCDAGLTSFVRNANLALLGRRPLGEAEVAHYVGSGADSPGRRQAIVDEMMTQPEFVERWREALEDLLRVPRTDDQQMTACYAIRARAPDDGDLARFVASHDPASTGDGGGSFTMLDLLDSSLRADDLSVAYRAHLFALVAFPIPAANVPPVQAELARRQDYGNVFDAAYLNRDLVCLNCHNSEFSVTSDPDPAKNRHWPMRGHFERSLYGASTGEDPDSAHAVFRFEGFVGDPQFDPGARPWGWMNSCGEFHPDASLQDDPAGIDARFGSITGRRVSVYDLERSLRAGVESLAANGLQTAADGSVADPDQAFAYLVGASISEGVWRDIIGSNLTIANYFPRNQASRDELAKLTNDFVGSRFSLHRLLHDVVQGPWFNQLPPSAACTDAAYAYADVWDPWVTGDSDPARRKNSPGDAVAALPARVLLRASASALNWPQPDDRGFPQSDAQIDFYRGVGLFLKNSERGFRGLDFQARLVWENKNAACANPGGSSDAVDAILQKAGTTSGATVRDVAVALKDRINGETAIDDSTPSGQAERAAIEAIYGVPLDAPAASAPNLPGSTRKLCGVYLSTPQFLLSGFASTRLDPVPTLSP